MIWNQFLSLSLVKFSFFKSYRVDDSKNCKTKYDLKDKKNFSVWGLFFVITTVNILKSKTIGLQNEHTKFQIVYNS